MPTEAVVDLRVLILAPIGRDGALTSQLLSSAGVPCHVCADARELCHEIRQGAGAVLLTEEALADPGIDELAATLQTQPAWSDVSLLLFAGDDRSQATIRTLRTLEVMRNVTLLDRPIRVTAVISTVRAALRGRRRQYELRDVLAALESSRQDAERARDDAERANRLKDEFLATLSHELRTPLSPILGWVRLLRSGDLDAAAGARGLEVIERNVRAQTQLIEDLLDVSRIITGKLRLEVRPMDLVAVVEAGIEAVRPAADAKNIQIEARLDPMASAMVGDPDRLQQVVWNLVSNAVKFTPKEGRVEVELFKVDSHARLRVKDTGKGIPPGFLPHVFDRLRQADSTSTRAHGGLGIGLAIVRHLVELHGGRVTADNRPERGAIFTVELPA